MKELTLEPMEPTTEGKDDRVVGGQDSCGSDTIFEPYRSSRIRNSLEETDAMLEKASAWAAKISAVKGDLYADRDFKRSLIEIYANNYQIIKNQSF